MNILSGEITEIYIEDGITNGKVRVGTLFVRVPLLFLPQAKVGDTILIESGVAISRVEDEQLEER
jgi:hydrogenase maturation factor